jgi:ubiquinone/menaquinone biosynthesis C-methylase UbiE
VSDAEHDHAVREQFARTADERAQHAAHHASELARQVEEFVEPSGDERALDVGAGTGALALALASHVREIVALELVPEQVEHARRLLAQHPNATVVEGDATALPFVRAEFDLVCERAVLHHVRRPELMVAEMTRVCRPGGRVLVIDQLAPLDPLRAIEIDRFERARDATHTRLLSDQDLRHLFEINGLVLVRSRVEQHERKLDPYLDLSGCEGAEREQVRALAPADPYPVELGWYLVRRP